MGSKISFVILIVIYFVVVHVRVSGFGRLLTDDCNCAMRRPGLARARTLRNMLSALYSEVRGGIDRFRLLFILYLHYFAVFMRFYSVNHFLSPMHFHYAFLIHLSLSYISIMIY